MLKILVRIKDEFNNETQEFEFEDFELHFEHSLVSLSKWESKYEKAYLGDLVKTSEEILGYIECMIQNDKYPPDILDKLSEKNVKALEAYIDAKMTATTVNVLTSRNGSSERITSELIYFWITSYQIPWEVQHWHLNRLFMLLKLFGAKNAKDSKGNRMSSAEISKRNQQINEERRAQLGTKG